MAKTTMATKSVQKIRKKSAEMPRPSPKSTQVMPTTTSPNLLSVSMKWAIAYITLVGPSNEHIRVGTQERI